MSISFKFNFHYGKLAIEDERALSPPHSMCHSNDIITRLILRTNLCFIFEWFLRSLRLLMANLLSILFKVSLNLFLRYNNLSCFCQPFYPNNFKKYPAEVIQRGITI